MRKFTKLKSKTRNLNIRPEKNSEIGRNGEIKKWRVWDEGSGEIKERRFLEGPCELLTNYGREYDWNQKKWGSILKLKEELIKCENWIGDSIRCKDLPAARKGNTLERLLGIIVDGTMDNRALCSAVTENEGVVTGILTPGINYEKYEFGGWGRKEKNYELVDIKSGNKGDDEGNDERNTGSWTKEIILKR